MFAVQPSCSHSHISFIVTNVLPRCLMFSHLYHVKFETFSELFNLQIFLQSFCSHQLHKITPLSLSQPLSRHLRTHFFFCSLISPTSLLLHNKIPQISYLTPSQRPSLITPAQSLVISFPIIL